MKQTDESLMDAAALGSEEAQYELFRRHFRPIYSFILAIRANDRCKSDADEITNETFLRAFRDLPKFRRHCSFRGWLIALSHNAAIDFYRLKANRKINRASLGGPDGISHSSTHADTNTRDALASLLSDETRQHILSLLERLSIRHRLVIMLTHTPKCPLFEGSGHPKYGCPWSKEGTCSVPP